MHEFDASILGHLHTHPGVNGKIANQPKSPSLVCINGELFILQWHCKLSPACSQSVSYWQTFPYTEAPWSAVNQN